MQSKLKDANYFDAEEKRQKEYIKNIQQDRALKQKWSDFVMHFLENYSIFSGIIVLIGCFVLSVRIEIIMALLTTTLASIIALPMIICHNLFPNGIQNLD